MNGHRAGLRCNPDQDDYQSLRKCLDLGIKRERQADGLQRQRSRGYPEWLLQE